MANRKRLNNNPFGQYGDNEPLKTIRRGGVSYIDSSSLNRPLTLPRKNYPILLGVVALGVIAALIIGVAINHNVVHRDDRLREQVLVVANRGVSQDVPTVTDFADFSDDDFFTYMQDQGFDYVDMNAINNSPDYTVDIFKLPSDMTSEEASSAYTEGISSLDSVTATKLLSGSWRLTVNRDGGFSYNLRFADFNSDNPNAAIQKAIGAQGLKDTTFTDAGTDSSGNTYQSGQISLDGYDYTWTVSACNLRSVYRINGMPNSTQYVGVRLNYDRSAQ